MQCQAKCFVIEVERAGERENISVKARSSVLARKTVRQQYKEDVKIILVKEEKRKRPSTPNE